VTHDKLKELKLPDEPGVYRFVDAKGAILYIGKATSLRDRVRSYFSNDLLHTRGKHIVDMITLAHTVRHTTTDSALEALILEAALIKEHQPLYNTKEKDNKSFNYVVFTKELFPRVLVIRERTMLSGVGESESAYKQAFGPFPQGSSLIEALKIIRRIFPFRDKCEPETGTPCFNRQIGLCPGTCSGEMGVREYNEQLKNIKLFFEGRKSEVVRRLTRAMSDHAKKMEFELANEYKQMIFALKHIKDVSLLDQKIKEYSQRSSKKRGRAYRIEAYDIAHISGKYTVGVMVVVEDGEPKKSEYRKFKIRIEADRSDDTLHLEEVLMRRFNHPEWQKPDLLVIDGGTAQKRRAEKTLKTLALEIPIVSVVKDDKHKARAVLGNKEMIESYKRGILVANLESHRFAVAYHRELRDKLKK
jgi:excinuclease ABC subunit C